MKSKRILFAVCLLLISATLLGTASFAWFSMNTSVDVDGIQVEAYSDSLFLEVSETNADDDFHTSITLASEGEQVLRLAKHGFVGKVYNLTIASGNGNYSGSGTYYTLIAETGDSLKKYVKASDLKYGSELNGLYKNLEFTACANDATADGSTTYYKVDAGKFVPVVKALGASVKGHYTLATVTPTAETSGYYAGGSDKFFYKGTDDSYSDVTATLSLGSNLAEYFEITNVEEISAAAATGDVYIGNKEINPDEFAFLATYATATDITDTLYFGRAYSDTIVDGDLDDTLSIIKEASLDSYRYANTIYLRNAENTNNSENLKALISVGGSANELSNSIRVLLVASIKDSSSEFTYVNSVLYNHRDGSLTYETGSSIVEVLLGNKAETVKIDVYVYFDGSDADATNANVPAGILNGQTVEIKFTVDGATYN